MTEHFIRERFGWVCKGCRDAARAGGAYEGEDEVTRAFREGGRARFFHEGEAEEREPRLSTPSLARWRDAGGRRTLFCPQCGAEEEVENSDK